MCDVIKQEGDDVFGQSDEEKSQDGEGDDDEWLSLHFYICNTKISNFI